MTFKRAAAHKKRAGITKTRDPRPWRHGKLQKGKWDSTNRYIRRQVRRICRERIENDG